MFVPLHDHNPLQRIKFQYVTIILILINAAIFIIFQSGLVYPVNATNVSAVQSFAVVPFDLINEGLLGSNVINGPYDTVPLAERWTLISYMFLHGGWMHLIGNMLFLWVFGDNVEDAMGHMRFLVFYLLCGIFAGYAHALMSPSSNLPLIGASGAVAGVVAAYLMLHPKVRVWVLVLWRFPVPISAGIALGGWVILQFVNVYLTQGGNVAWWAHIGGLAAGAVLVLFMRRPGVPLFDQTALETKS